MAGKGLRHARLLWPLLASVGLTVVLSLTLRSNSRAVTNPHPVHHGNISMVAVVTDPHAAHHGDVPMTEESMRRWVDDWFSSHPIRPTASRPAQPAATVADTFLVGPAGQFIFDTDGNINTPVDTARCRVGEAIMWRWVSGSHTITNGIDSTDPQAGSLFDAPSTSLATTFQFTFNTEGTYHFFCRPHDFLGMEGYVVVRPALAVPPGPANPVAIGFAAGPSPNPSPSAVNFQIALRERGMVHADVFDSRGRLVATVLNREFDAGSHAVSWDGRTRAGAPAPVGVYYVRLRMPGFNGSRAVVIER